MQKRRTCGAIGLLSAAMVVSSLAVASARSHETTSTTQPERKAMMTQAKGEFDVKLVPQAGETAVEGAAMGRMSIDKVFRGDLDGTSKGEMLTAMSPSMKDSGVYVAVERVTGTLSGRKGSFAMHHTGIMDRGQQNLTVTIVPDSGTGELAGIRGKMTIIIEGKKHLYELEYRVEK